MMTNLSWKLITVIFLALNVPICRDAIVREWNPAHVNNGMLLIIQALGQDHLQSFQVEGAPPDKYTFLKVKDPGFRYIINTIKSQYKKRDIKLTIEEPDIILDQQILQWGKSASNVFTTERLIYFAKLKDINGDIKHQSVYSEEEFRALLEKEEVVREETLINWVLEKKSEVLEVSQLLILLYILSLILIQPWKKFWLECWREALYKTFKIGT